MRIIRRSNQPENVSATRAIMGDDEATAAVLLAINNSRNPTLADICEACRDLGPNFPTGEALKSLVEKNLVTASGLSYRLTDDGADAVFFLKKLARCTR